MRLLRYATALILLATGCQKEDVLPVCQGACTTITGQLITGNQRVGIAGADVTIKWLVPNGLSVKTKTKARTTTDADGNYRVTFFIEDAELADGYFSVFYSVDESQYYAIGKDQDAFYHLKRDTTFNLKPYIIPRRAYVRLAITNQNQLISDKGGYFTSVFNTCYGHNLIFNRAIKGGGSLITWNSLPYQNPLPVAGDQPILVTSSKTKQGVTTYNTDSIFIVAGTTRDYTVTY